MNGEALYVIDDYAVLALPSLCESNSLPHLLDTLTDMVKEGTLCFPDQVIHDCAELAKGEIVHTWIKAVHAHRPIKRVPVRWQEDALGLCTDLCDYDDENEQSPVLVAAMALMIRAEYPKINLSVVTEDRSALPTRMCLNAACPQLGLTPVTARDFLAATKASRYLQ